MFRFFLLCTCFVKLLNKYYYYYHYYYELNVLTFHLLMFFSFMHFIFLVSFSFTYLQVCSIADILYYRDSKFCVVSLLIYGGTSLFEDHHWLLKNNRFVHDEYTIFFFGGQNFNELGFLEGILSPSFPHSWSSAVSSGFFQCLNIEESGSSTLAHLHKYSSIKVSPWFSQFISLGDYCRFRIVIFFIQ